ncbi:MAG: T9SS type A sorting domain-containing protein, partial [Bacteroidales bacterium]
GVSTSGLNPSDFTIISAGSYVEAPVANWTEFTYDLSAYAGQNVYVGIQCVSNDAFILLVDDVTIGATKSPIVYNPSQPVVGKGIKDINYTLKPAAQPATKVQSSRNINSELMGYNVYRDGVKINTAVVENQEYTDTDLPVNTFEYYVTAVYDAGESNPSNTVVIVITDLADITADNEILVYPNPASDYLNIKAENIMHIRILNTLGQVVVDKVIGSDNSNLDISDLKSGIYFIHLDTQKGSVTRKVVVK